MVSEGRTRNADGSIARAASSSSFSVFVVARAKEICSRFASSMVAAEWLKMNDFQVEWLMIMVGLYGNYSNKV